MNKNKKYISIGSLILLISIGVFYYLNLIQEKDPPLVNQIVQTQIEDHVKEEIQKETPIKEIKKKEAMPVVEDIRTIKVSLIVLDKRYETNIKENSSVFEVMENIQKESTPDNVFSFRYTNNASLGNFITEINGAEGSPGKYWIYYVNDKKASIGVSNYILKEGDIINWSQEGI